jgi:hypothetical protein
MQLITKVCKNMKEQNLSDVDDVLLRKRALIELVNDELRNIYNLEHIRHRSIMGFLLNLNSDLNSLLLSSLNITPINDNQLSLWAA